MLPSGQAAIFGSDQRPGDPVCEIATCRGQAVYVKSDWSLYRHRRGTTRLPTHIYECRQCHTRWRLPPRGPLERDA